MRSIFSAFGKVQTCIVNIEKRHAFVKMLSREEAVRAKDGMEHYKHGDMQLRVSKQIFFFKVKQLSAYFHQTRWGVGFGPRDCSDYQTGISIIPIDRLTDADRKWMVNAEYGGSGGKPIAEGICVEEPDIEIGAGVSSKGKLAFLANANNNTNLPPPQLSAVACKPTRAVTPVPVPPANLEARASATASQRGAAAKTTNAKTAIITSRFHQQFLVSTSSSP